MKKKYIFSFLLLITILVISSIYFIKNYKEQNDEENIFENLRNEIEETDEIGNYHSKDETTRMENKDFNNLKQVSCCSVNLKALKEQNSDLKGYIQIDDTNISYPVMQNGTFYLYKNLNKNNSSLGTPFLASYCDIEKDKNLIIYGHNMKSGKMFSDLVKYKNYNFYQNHKIIKFYTLKNDVTIKSEYEIVFVFKTAINDENFKYYNYYKLNEESEYIEFIENCKSIELYNTGIKTNFNDRFITLSTCEYSQTNGRMVVVARKIS